MLCITLLGGFMKKFGTLLVVALAFTGCSTEKAPQSQAANEIETSIQAVSIEKSASTEGEDVSFRFYVVMGTGESATKLDFAATLPGDEESLDNVTAVAMQCASIECDAAIAEEKAAAFTAQVTCKDSTCDNADIQLAGREGGIYRGRKATLSKRVLKGLNVETVTTYSENEVAAATGIQVIEDQALANANFILKFSDAELSARIEITTVSKSPLRNVKASVDFIPQRVESASGATTVIQNQIGVTTETDAAGKQRKYFYQWQLREKGGKYQTSSSKVERELTMTEEKDKLTFHVVGNPSGALDLVFSGDELVAQAELL